MSVCECVSLCARVHGRRDGMCVCVCVCSCLCVHGHVIMMRKCIIALRGRHSARTEWAQSRESRTQWCGVRCQQREVSPAAMVLNWGQRLLRGAEGQEIGNAFSLCGLKKSAALSEHCIQW